MRMVGVVLALLIVGWFGWQYSQREDLGDRINRERAERCGVSLETDRLYQEKKLSLMVAAQQRRDKAAEKKWLREFLACPPREFESDLAAVGATLGKDDTLEQTADRLAAVDGTITADKYAQLETGMDYEAAARILGSYGEEVSRTEISGVSPTVMYAWKNPDGSNMTAMFQGGGLVMKSQFGLR